MSLRNITGAGLLLFVFGFTSIVLIGFFGQELTGEAKLFFHIGFGLLFVFILGTIYIMHFEDVPEGITEHAVIIIAILIASLGFSSAIANMQESYLVTKNNAMTIELQREILQLQEQNIAKRDYEQQLSAVHATIQQNTITLLEQAVNAKNKQAEETYEQQEKALLAAQEDLQRQVDAFVKRQKEQEADLLARQEELQRQAEELRQSQNTGQFNENGENDD